MRKGPTLFLALVFWASMSLVFIVQPHAAHAKSLHPPKTAIPQEFFGMHMHRAGYSTPWPSVPFKTWRLWDAYVTWPYLEPIKGDWHFERLDRLVKLAEQNQVEIILPLGLSPNWASARPWEASAYSPGNAAEPRDMDDWRDYVRTVATRYKGRIVYYEIWNEPNLSKFFSGTVQDMVNLTRTASAILKEIDPSITVVSPSSAGDGSGPAWLDEFLRQGGGDFTDVVGYHFYVGTSPPEAMEPLIRKIKSIMKRRHIAKPLWNTESGWDRSKVFASADEAAAYVARSYIVNWAAGVERFCWYAWDNKGWVGLRLTDDDDKTLSSAGVAYGVVQGWLVGARMGGCSTNGAGTWTCSLSRAGEYAAWVTWNPNTSISMRIKNGWKIKSIRTLSGGSVPVSRTVEVGPSPLLLENLPRE